MQIPVAIVQNRPNNIGYLLQAKSGQYTQILPGANSTSSTGTINQGRTIPFAFFDSIVITEVYINVTTQIASSVIRLGIYMSDSLGLPSNLLSDFGTVDTSTTGEKSILSLSQNLDGGILYHFCWVPQGGASAPSCSAAKPLFQGGPATTRAYTDHNYGALSTTTISGILPNTFPWAGTIGPASPSPPVIFAKIA